MGGAEGVLGICGAAIGVPVGVLGVDECLYTGSWNRTVSVLTPVHGVWCASSHDSETSTLSLRIPGGDPCKFRAGLEVPLFLPDQLRNATES